jgi:hypothetical protein
MRLTAPTQASQLARLRRRAAALALCCLTPLRCLLTLTLALTALTSREAAAQSLDVRLDSSVSGGLMVGSAGRDTIVGASPMMMDFDAAFIFDGDQNVEWVIGALMQMQYTPAFGLNPQIRLRRHTGPFETFASVGVPFYLAPLTRFGTEVSLGAAFPKDAPLAVVANISATTFFMGADLPQDSAVFTFNGAVGLRINF